MTSDHRRQAHEHAFHTFRGQPDRGDGRDLASGKSLAVAQPENRALSFLIFPGGNLPENLVDMLKLHTLAYGVKAVGASCFQLYFDWFYFPIADSYGLNYATLCSQRAFEMIMNNVCRNYL